MNKKDIITFIKKHSFILGFTLTVLFTILGFFLSLQLSLYGDDWLRLHILKYNFDKGIGMSYFSIWSYLGPYNAQYPMLFFVRLFGGYNPFGYFLTSLILRIIGSASFYFPLKKITKSNLVAWFGAILIGTTPIGIQVTDWVFYMNTYLSLVFLSGAFYFILKMEDLPSVKNQLLILLFSLFFIFIIPVRSYGFFFTLVVLSLIKIIWQKKTKRKFAVIQLISLLLIYATAKIVGSLGPTTDVISAIQTGARSSYFFLIRHSYSFLLVPLVDFGKILLPDMFYGKLQVISARFFQPQIISYVFLFFILGLGYVFWKNVPRSRFILWSLINISIIPVIQIVFVLVNPADQLYASLSFWLIFNIGYYTLFKRAIVPIIVFLLFIFCFSLPYYVLPWSFDPSVALNSDHRYLYFPALGIMMAVIIVLSSFMKNKDLKKMIIPLLSFAILANIASDVIYFRGQLRFRSEQRQQKIFASLHKVVPTLPESSQSIFYITDTTGKRTDVYSFGFPFYMGLSYNINNQGILPFIIPNLDELHSAITDGKVLKKYTETIRRTDPDKIYYLKLLPNDSFIVNKVEVMNELKAYEK